MKHTEYIVPIGEDAQDYDEMFIGVIRRQPELVRCKDCKFATITDGVYGREPYVKYCDIWFPNEAEYMPVNYYCASAERKEE